MLKFNIILAGILLISTSSICLAQGLFVRTNGEFIITNVMAANLVMPGSGNIIYTKKAREESKIMRGLTFVSGIWSIYNTANYIHQYLDSDNNTPTRCRTMRFLISYLIGNILCYNRLTRYNFKIKNIKRLEFDYGLMENCVYAGFVYQF